MIWLAIFAVFMALLSLYKQRQRISARDI